MNEFINVKVEKDEVIDLLVNRVRFWTDNKDVIELFRKMYENYVEAEVFNELDVNLIVDNDYVNYCGVIEKGDEEFEKVQELAKQGYYDISCETDCYEFIESYNEDYSLILVRYK